MASATILFPAADGTAVDAFLARLGIDVRPPVGASPVASSTVSARSVTFSA